MSFRTDLLPLVDAVRELQATYGTVNSTLSIITRTWSGGKIDSGSASDATLTLGGYYKIRELAKREIVGSGGRYEDGAIRITVTPSDGASVGYTQAQLAPRPTVNGVEVIYRVAGEINGDYRLAGLHADRGYHYTLVLNRMRTTPVE